MHSVYGIAYALAKAVPCVTVSATIYFSISFVFVLTVVAGVLMSVYTRETETKANQYRVTPNRHHR